MLGGREVGASGSDGCAMTPGGPGSGIRLEGVPLWRGPLVADVALASRAAPFSAPDWIFELKHDGYRLLAAKVGDAVELRYRNGRVVTSTYPELEEAVGSLPHRVVLLDGELVAHEAGGRPNLDLLRARSVARGARGTSPGRVAFCVFDLLALDGHDTRDLPLLARKTLLRAVVGSGDRLRYVDHVTEQGEQLYERARELRIEGVVAKKADSAYRAGRTGTWRKMKVEETLDLRVIGVAAPAEATSWHPGLVLARADAGGLRYAGRVAVGPRELRALELPGLRRATSPCAGSGTAEVWLEPTLTCEVRSRPSDRGLDHPVFLRFRPDKHAIVPPPAP